MKWSFAQFGLLIICVFHVVQAVVGFVAEPSFAVGPDAPTVQIMGMDYNGWHAVAGLALFAPGLVFAMRKSWSVLYLLVAAVAGALPGIWAFSRTRSPTSLRFPTTSPMQSCTSCPRRDVSGGGGADPPRRRNSKTHWPICTKRGRNVVANRPRAQRCP